MAIWNKEIWYSCYSPRIKQYLTDSNFIAETSFSNIKNGKTCFVYRKTKDLVYFLALLKYRDENKLDYKICQCAKYAREHKIFPETSLEDYDLREFAE